MDRHPRAVIFQLLQDLVPSQAPFRQNQIVALVFYDLETNATHRADIGRAINFLGQNATTVFGDPGGMSGIARLLNGSVLALSNGSKYYNGSETYLQAYGRAIAVQVNPTALFLIELAKQIPLASPSSFRKQKLNFLLIKNLIAFL
jgi:hypothetical protein